MRKAEQRLWDTMKRNAPKDVWLNRIENLLDPGITDVLVMRENRTAWVELKAPSRPMRDTSMLLKTNDVRTAQINWMLKAAKMGQNVMLVMRDDCGQLYVLPGLLAPTFRGLKLADARRYSICGSWDRFWELI